MGGGVGPTLGWPPVHPRTQPFAQSFSIFSHVAAHSFPAFAPGAFAARMFAAARQSPNRFHKSSVPPRTPWREITSLPYAEHDGPPCNTAYAQRQPLWGETNR
jgi:hypothetical protein